MLDIETLFRHTIIFMENRTQLFNLIFNLLVQNSMALYLLEIYVGEKNYNGDNSLYYLCWLDDRQ